MIVIGASGFAKQIIGELVQEENLVFFDDINLDCDSLGNTYPILHTDEAVRNHFLTNNRFVLGVGSSLARKQLSSRFIQLGGRLSSVISPKASISSYADINSPGIAILEGAIVEPDVVLGEGCLLNIRSMITHDCKVGKYTEVAPGAILLGGCTVGDSCQIGSGAVVLPKVRVGHHVTIGAGAVVTRNVPDNMRAVGVPAKQLPSKL